MCGSLAMEFCKSSLGDLNVQAGVKTTKKKKSAQLNLEEAHRRISEYTAYEKR